MVTVEPGTLSKDMQREVERKLALPKLHCVKLFCGTKQLQSTVSVTEAGLAQGQEVQATTTVDISKVQRALSGLTPRPNVR